MLSRETKDDDKAWPVARLTEGAGMVDKLQNAPQVRLLPFGTVVLDILIGTPPITKEADEVGQSSFEVLPATTARISMSSVTFDD